LTKKALTQPDFQKRVDLLHQAERIALTESRYVVTQFTPYLSVTRTDTWTNYQPSPQPDGQPFGISWVQLQGLEAGGKSSSSAVRAASAW
jgi:hypothetical protein